MTEDPLTALADVDAEGCVLGVEVLDGGDWRDALAALARSGRLVIREGA